MQISDDRLKEFQEAYALDFEETITPAEAQAMLSRLVTFFQLLDEARRRQEIDDDAVSPSTPSQ